MSRRKRIRYVPSKKPCSPFTLLDRFSVEDILKWASFKDKFLRYHWDYYSDLAYRRSKISDKIKQSLLETTQTSFTFQKWQRAIKYKYALEPFSVTGSLIDPGGRFNIGDINPSQFPPFPALYFATDKETALQELLSQKIVPNREAAGLDPLDFALTTPDSIAVVSLSGSLNSIINLKEPNNLQPFVDLIKDFSIPEWLKKAANDIGEQQPELIRNVSKLVDSLLDSNWRLWPMQFDVPASSQIFGQLVSDARIEGILYISKFTGSDCLAVFPQNFDEESFIQLDDEIPEGIKIHRLDSKTWKVIQK